MQLHDIISSDQSAVHRALLNFKAAIHRNGVWCPKEDIQFVFLCGANIDEKTPSKRRQDLIDFSLHQIPHTKFFLAETIFNHLDGYNSNLLDIEHDLSSFSDYIIIVLESESAFCELGAFAMREELRRKLIIINDCEFKASKSFIKRGPIDAIVESAGQERILYYKMDKNGKVFGDRIGDIYRPLYDLINKVPSYRRRRAENIDPTGSLTKNSLRFIFDLVYLMGPITLEELSRIIKILFIKSADKKMRNLLAVLLAFKEVQKINTDYFVVDKERKLFYEYDFDCYLLKTAFKNMYYKYDKLRFE